MSCWLFVYLTALNLIWANFSSICSAPTSNVLLEYRVLVHLEFPIWQPINTKSTHVRSRHCGERFFNGSPRLSTSADLPQLTVPQHCRESGGTVPCIRTRVWVITKKWTFRRTYEISVFAFFCFCFRSSTRIQPDAFSNFLSIRKKMLNTEYHVIHDFNCKTIQKGFVAPPNTFAGFAN